MGPMPDDEEARTGATTTGDRVPAGVARGPLVPLPAQPEGTPWPTDGWPEGDVPTGVGLDGLLAEAFDGDGPLETTYAVAVVHRGRLVAERYSGRSCGHCMPIVRFSCCPRCTSPSASWPWKHGAPGAR